MPTKHQAACYRTRKGLRYINDGDICDATFGALHIQATARVRELREQGHKAFAERHPDGFYRVFVLKAAEPQEVPYGPDHPSYIAPLADDLVELLRGREFDKLFPTKKQG